MNDNEVWVRFATALLTGAASQLSDSITFVANDGDTEINATEWTALRADDMLAEYKKRYSTEGGRP